MASPLPGSCVRLLERLVAHDTVNPVFGGPPAGQAVLVDTLAGWARAWGLTVRRLPVSPGLENLLILAEAASDAPWLLFDSHLDTVSAAGMTVPPLTLTARDGRYYGRGACDTKGSGAAMLWALADFSRQPDRHQTVGILFTIDEESGMTGARAFARDQLPALLPKLRGVVVGEPTGLRPVVATNGVLRWVMHTRGVAAHSSEPARGRSAISAMLRVVASFETHYVPSLRATHPLSGRAAASINVIRGGTQVNIIPEECSVECDRRLVPGETAEAALAACQAIVADASPVEYDAIYSVPPLPETGSEAFVRAAEPAFHQAELSFVRTGAAYVTNASIYAAAGAPVLVAGPGDAAQAHRADEWIAAEQLDGAVRLYRALMTAKP